MVIQHYEGLHKMKKVISILSGVVLLFSSHVFAEQDKESVEVCNEAAKSEGVSSDKVKEYVDKCVKDIADDEKREKAESAQDSK